MPTKNKNNKTPKISKASSNYGKWIYKTTISEVLLCKCGNKYLKTRKGQETCVKCLRKTF